MKHKIVVLQKTRENKSPAKPQGLVFVPLNLKLPAMPSEKIKVRHLLINIESRKNIFIEEKQLGRNLDTHQ